MLVFYVETRIVLIKPNMMGSMDKKMIFWFPVENKSCKSCISHEITLMWSIIKILSCNTSIDDVDSHTPYFDVFVWRSCSMLKEVRNITTQYILVLAEYPYGILIGKTPKLFLLNWVQLKSSFYISKFLIRTFIFTIERICISACRLNYYVHFVTCIHKFIISW